MKNKILFLILVVTSCYAKTEYWQSDSISEYKDVLILFQDSTAKIISRYISQDTTNYPGHCFDDIYWGYWWSNCDTVEIHIDTLYYKFKKYFTDSILSNKDTVLKPIISNDNSSNWFVTLFKMPEGKQRWVSSKCYGLIKSWSRKTKRN